MASPRIIIADRDINYIAPIQLKFIEEFFDKIQLEVITDEDYYDQYFYIYLLFHFELKPIQ